MRDDTGDAGQPTAQAATDGSTPASPMQYVLSVWGHVHDNAVKLMGEGDWDWLLGEIQNPTRTDDKRSVPLFNLTRFDSLVQKTGAIVEDKVIGGWHDQRVQRNITK